MRRFLYLRQTTAEAIIIPFTVLSVVSLAAGIIRVPGYILILLIGLTFLGMSYIAVNYIGFIWGSGYGPTERVVIERVFELTKPEPRMKVFDLGSGLGRVVLQLAERHGVSSIGIEVDPLKVWWTRSIIRSRGLQNKVKIVKSNLLDVDLSDADLVYVFLWPTFLEEVKRKLANEMKQGARVVTHLYPIPGWTPAIHDRDLGIMVYEIGKGTA